MEEKLDEEVDKKEKELKKKPEEKAKTNKNKETKIEIEIELPFSGEIDEKRCKGIRTAGKLYTQCLVYVEGTRYCKKCQKESQTNENLKPNLGDIEERNECGLYEFKDKDGKNPWPYYKLMRKHGWTREYVEEVGRKHGITISEEHFNDAEMNIKVHQKGRKGRPKKDAKEVVIEEPEIPQMDEEEEMNELNKMMEELEDEDKDEDEVEDDVQGLSVNDFKHEGVEYLRTTDGLIYDKDSCDDPILLGKWDEETQTIDFEYEEESDEE